MGFHFVLFFRVIPLLVAGVVLAIRIYTRGEKNHPAVRRPLHEIRSRREVRQLLCFSSIHREQIHLRISAPRREKGNCLAVRRPHRRRILAALGQLQRFPAAHRRNPDIARVPVRVKIRRRYRVRHPLAVRRNLRLPDAMHPHHVLERDRVLAFLRSRACSGTRRDQAGHRERPHGHSRPARQCALDFR